MPHLNIQWDNLGIYSCISVMKPKKIEFYIKFKLIINFTLCVLVTFVIVVDVLIVVIIIIIIVVVIIVVTTTKQQHNDDDDNNNNNNNNNEICVAHSLCISQMNTILIPTHAQ
jgi:Ca2+/Na+ antiporter